MKFDQYGQSVTTEEELFDLLYVDPTIDLGKFFVRNPMPFNMSNADLYAGYTPLKQYAPSDEDLNTFDKRLQSNWYMPQEYKDIDIAKWLLDQCKEDYELQRVGEELLLYQERNLFDLLRFLKYMVDTFRKENVVWGVGRGSSVASYVLYLLNVHRINSIYYDLDIKEFLR